MAVYLSIDDEAIHFECEESEDLDDIWLCSRDDTTSMSPRALLAFSGVSHSIRAEVAHLFTAGEYGMKAVFKQSMAVFRGVMGLSAFADEFPDMAGEVRAVMVIGWQFPYDERDNEDYYESALNYWPGQAGLYGRFIGMFDMYPALTRVEMRRARCLVHMKD